MSASRNGQESTTVAIIGAGFGGIGAATAQVLHDRGANLVLTDLRQASQLLQRAYPAPLRKPIKPERVAAITGAAGGIERRSPRIVVPRRWIPFSLLRGILNPLVDRRLERDAEIRRLVLEVEREATRTTEDKSR